jgi:Delta3-Delta2-enoyl-CoA isomerase
LDTQRSFEKMAGPVTLEYKGKIAVITIDNVEKLNALDQDGYYQLASFMREVAGHEEVFVTVLTGKGRSHPTPNIN